MSEVLCFWCANSGTSEQPLVHDEFGRLGHPGGDCLPLPDGYGQCARCHLATPLERLTAAVLTEAPGSTRGWHQSDLFLMRESDGFPGRWGTNDAAGKPLYLHLWNCSLPVADEGPARQTGTPTDRVTDEDRLASIPPDGDGLRIEELVSLWGVSLRQARNLIGRLLDTGDLVAEDVATPRGGKAPKAYWRAS